MLVSILYKDRLIYTFLLNHQTNIVNPRSTKQSGSITHANFQTFFHPYFVEISTSIFYKDDLIYFLLLTDQANIVKPEQAIKVDSLHSLQTTASLTSNHQDKSKEDANYLSSKNINNNNKNSCNTE